MPSIEYIMKAAEKSSATSSGRSQIDCVSFCNGYAEPGYSDPESGVIAFGNWNDVTSWDTSSGELVVLDKSPSRLAKILERVGVELEWSDEWTTCGECGKAVRTQPDCWHWRPFYRIKDECELVCLECHKDEEEDEEEEEQEEEIV